jgi:iron complex transport system substrate-binding protein
MVKRRKIFSWVLVLALLLTCYLLGGCGQTETGSPDVDQQQGAEQGGQTERTFVDDAGREVTVPVEIKKVFSANHIGTLLLYSINPDKVAGWNGELRPGELKYFDEKYHGLPVLGSWHISSTGSIEELLGAGPDVIISTGFANVYDEEFIEGLQEQTGIPVVHISVELEEMDHAYERLGELINEKEVTDRLAAYCRDTVAEISEKAKQVPEERARVYCAMGPSGLSTAPVGSHQMQVLEMVKGINVAEVELPPGMGGMTDVSLEQVLHWDPAVIFCWSSGQGGNYRGITSDPDWKDIEAVKNGRVYEIPDLPASWFANPPSVNRVLGLKWAGHLLYPEVFDYDLVKEAKEFYDLFYHCELTDEEAAELLENAA